MEQNADAPGLRKEYIEMAMSKSRSHYQSLTFRSYVSEGYKASNPSDPFVSPLLAPSHKGLPPAFIQVAGLDPLRDEGFLYEKVLKDSDVSTRLIACVFLILDSTCIDSITFRNFLAFYV